MRAHILSKYYGKQLNIFVAVFFSCLLVAGTIFTLSSKAEASTPKQPEYIEPVAEYLETNWRREVPFTLTTLSDTEWTNLTPVTNLGASFICENHNIILTIASSTANADANFLNGLFCLWDNNTYRIIPTKQRQSGYYFYAKCHSDDIDVLFLDNDVAVDKGTDPETVGIPITGHTFSAGDYVAIATQTKKYDGTYRIVSKTANEIVIYHAYIVDTFIGTDTATVTPTVFSSLGGS